MGKFYTESQIETRALSLLRRYANSVGSSPGPPISAEDILDTVLAKDLGSLSWELVEEPEGVKRFAYLDSGRRVIVLNEARRDEIFGTPGFYNTIIAHEIGHLVLHIDSARLHQNVLFRLDSIATNDVEHSIDQWDETNAHRFMAHLLMPAELVVPLARESDLSSWQGLYHLREEFDVTITAMRIRLEKLGFNYVDENGVFHRSRSEALGQKRLI